MLEIGKTLSKDYLVDENKTARVLGSGDLEVLATPILVAFMEDTAKELVRGDIEETSTTVGSKIDCDHLAPTGVGHKVFVCAKLVEVEKRKLVFSIEAKDDKNVLIGKASHIRYIVDKERFMGKVNGN
jgi:predicted thioesterase